MKKVFFLSFLFMAFAALGFAENAALDFTLVNQTGKDIHYVYLSPADDDNWGDDVMGEDILANKDKVDITFSPKSKSDVWDLKVEYEDGTTNEWTNLDLTTITTLTLKIEKGKPMAYYK